MTDARFQDGKEKPLKLIARDKADAEVVSALIQDSIAERKEMLFDAKRREFSLLLRRFRWEDMSDAKRQNRELERVQSVLTFKSILEVQSAGIDTQDKGLVFDLIGLIIEDTAIRIVFAGEGEIRLKTEAIDIFLSDVSRPYIAKTQTAPRHQDD